MPVSAHSPPILRRLLPVLGWLPAYRRAWLLPDVLAGLAVWAVPTGSEERYALALARPDRLLSGLEELPALLAPGERGA